MSNDLSSIPCVLMRGGTSKGPFFLASDLPSDLAARDRLLVEVMGSGHPLQIDGIGGGNALTSKVAIIDRASRPDADVDYLFAQVKVEQRLVDTSPNCGNMLAAVGPYAIERGLVQGQHPRTQVRIHNVNTGKVIVATVETPNGNVVYRGDTHIAGAPGSAAPVQLSFLDAAGSRTGRLLPSGHAMEQIDGVDVSLVDCAMPMVLMRATDLGLHGGETPAELNANRELMQRMEAIRIQAGERMGIADAGSKVIPKPVVISAPQHGGHLQVRYFMPHQCHTALAITGGVGIATAAATPGTLANTIVGCDAVLSVVTLEHPSGALDVGLSRSSEHAPVVASVVRTARRLFEGRVFATTPIASAAAQWTSAA
ncbi:4-oxalomesaconate tautomerase [Stenotrophomonas bentonitica]|uniref:4-oxalomesaconate tautomerase n=1 Tax=Stenotrophomonas bentonitica TaxID=1450134 RepID=UPI00345F037B